jgi:hypothetical protein
MHAQEDVELVLSLVRHGLNNSEISRATGINRTTIRDWRLGRTPRLPVNCWCNDSFDLRGLPSTRYAYLLGLYLGDGLIVRHRNGVFQLRIFMDSRYPNIIVAVAASMSAVIPNSKVNVGKHALWNMVVISSYSKHWPCLLPQHGRGRKHERHIQLCDWQQSIVEHHPEAFLRGLIHSDGCRYMNRVSRYEYPSYGFSNASQDIIGVFTNACAQLGIAWRRSNKRNIAITRREAVAMMDTFVGPKS